MYRPKFCAECSVKIIRLRWRLWTSRRFCDSCAQRFVRDEVKRTLIVCVTLFLLGAAAGHAAKRTPPPLVIQRHPKLELSDEQFINRVSGRHRCRHLIVEWFGKRRH